MENTLVHYMTGVVHMDAEHSDLFTLLGGLNGEMSDEEWLQHFDTLRQHWVDHLNSEESIMVAANYPYMAYHTEEHKRLTVQVQGLIDKLKRDPRHDFKWLKRQMEELIKSHIEDHDMQVGTWINRADKI